MITTVALHVNLYSTLVQRFLISIQVDNYLEVCFCDGNLFTLNLIIFYK